MSTVVIELDGTDITDLIKISTAVFNSAVNGLGGTCSFEIRDLDHVFGPVVGKPLTVTIDGTVKWAGYALSASRQYAFAVDDTSDPTKTERMFLMEGVDNNVLFQKRVAWNKDHPTQGKLPPPLANQGTKTGMWAEGTSVEDLVPYLIENYTTMFDDGVTMDVDDFGSWNPDDDAAISGGVTVGEMMADINRSLSGVWYLMPDYTFRYHSADTVTTDWIFTDKPSGDHDIGPRSYSFLSDGTHMVNDAFVWATALGWSTVTFSRAQDHDDTGQVSSITDHGRWQYGEFNTQMHRQATVDQRARTIVFGLDASQQGARWDQVIIEATTSETVFNVGDVVTCKSEVYTGVRREPFNAPGGNGESTGILQIDLPIRRMRLTFISPTEPRFTYELTREIDDPFSAFESRFPPFHIPPIPVINPGELPGPGTPPTTDCSGVCGITDAFGRTVAANNSDIGTSDAGIPWVVNDGGVGATVEVSPVDGLILEVPGGETFGTEVELDNLVIPGPEFRVMFRVMFTDFVPTESSRLDINYVAFLRLNPGLTTSSATVSWGLDTAHMDVAWEQDVWYNIELASEDNKTTLDLGIWKDGEARNTTPVLTGIDMTSDIYDLFSWEVQNQGAPGTFRVQLDELSISNYDKCSVVQYDDFQRTTDPDIDGWDVATSGFKWKNLGPGTGFREVDPGTGEMIQADFGTVPNQHGNIYSYDDTSSGVWGGDFDLRAEFDLGSLPSTSHTGTLAQWALALSAAQPFDGSLDEFIMFAARDHLNGDADTVTFGATTVASPVSLSTSTGPIRIRWTKTGGSHAIKVWSPFDGEPDTPTITASSPTISPKAFVVFQQQPFTRSFLSDPSSSLVVNWHWIDFFYEGRPCYSASPCASTLFDDFERTVAPGGWDSSTPTGRPWTVVSTGATFSVDGHDGVVAITGFGASAQVPDDASAPWAGDSLVMTVPFSISAAPTGSDWTGFSSTIAARFNCIISAHTSSVPPDPGASPPTSWIGGQNNRVAIPPAFWVAGGEYVITSTLTGGDQLSVSITDGVDTYSTDPELYGAFESFDFAFNSTFAQTIKIHSIDFDYEGRCPDECSGLTDSFTRTVLEVTHTSNSGTTTAPIGTCDAGVTWTGLNLGGGPFNLSSGGMGAAVNGSALVLRGIWSTGTNVHGGQANYYLPVDVAQDHTATKSFTFKLDSLPTNGSGVRIPIPGGAPVGTKVANIYANPSGAGGATSYIGFTTTTADSTSISNGFWVAGTTYTATLQDDGTDTTITVTDGTTTYSRTSSGYTGSRVFHPAIGVTWDTLLPFSFDDSVSIEIDNLDIPEIRADCGQVVVPPPSTGYAGELATRLSDTLYKVASPYVSGSSSVSINGTKQVLGTDYTEQPTDGTVTFTSTHPDTDKIYVTYVSMLPSPVTVPVAGAYYISPTGNDSTGDGSAGSPWATIAKFVTVATAGATLYCRGGSYTGVTRTIIGTGTGTPTGTAGSPITIRNYPGETPVFNGPGAGSFEQFLMFTDGVAYWTIDGLVAQGFKVGSSGVIYVGRNVGLMVPTHHIVIRNCTISVVHEGGGPFNHPVYLSAYANNCTVQYNHLIGAQVGGSDGVGVNVGDHEPSPQGTLIEHNIFENFGSAGAIWWNGDLNTGAILHNTFLNPATIYISLRNYVSVTVRDNAGETASSINISDVNDSGHGVSTIDHNYFGQTFDSNYYLESGNTGIGAASDGADAGARSR